MDNWWNSHDIESIEKSAKWFVSSHSDVLFGLSHNVIAKELTCLSLLGLDDLPLADRPWKLKGNIILNLSCAR